MSTLVCKDCGSRISDNIYVCPKCHSTNLVSLSKASNNKDCIVYYIDTNDCFRVLYKDSHFYTYDYTNTNQLAKNSNIRKFTESGAVKCINSLRKKHNDYAWNLKIMHV